MRRKTKDHVHIRSANYVVCAVLIQTGALGGTRCQLH